jgi:undecaprenyl diphosphate synthase
MRNALGIDQPEVRKNLANKIKPSMTLPKDLNPQHLPKHIAVIMDGNGRWAKKQGLPRMVGHSKGVAALKQMIIFCRDWGIETLTAYAFSTENWKRPFEEIHFLMTLFERTLDHELEAIHQEGVRITFIGDLEVLPQSLQLVMQLATRKTAENDAIHLQVAINYGSRHEQVKVCYQIAELVQQGQLLPSEVNEHLLEQFLDTAGTDDPDFLIRTSGEQRLSNFLLWQMAYTEMYFTDTLWPDFGDAELHQALLIYQNRNRRFGKI